MCRKKEAQEVKEKKKLINNNNMDRFPPPRSGISWPAVDVSARKKIALKSIKFSTGLSLREMVPIIKQ